MSTKTCRYCAEEIKEAAIKCRYCGSMLEPHKAAGEWYRDLENKILGGVCAGLEAQFGLSVTALRIAFVIGAFIGGWGLLIYLTLWVIMPAAKTDEPPSEPIPNVPPVPRLPEE